MSAVTKQEIVAMIEGLIESDACMGSISDKQVIMALELVNRIKQHGIALSRKYVPMTDEELSDIYFSAEQDELDGFAAIQTAVINRAGLEVEK